MRLAVAATAAFGADVLERLAATNEVAFVLTRPDAPRGRGRKLAAPPVKEAAERLGIPVLQPEKPELPAELGSDITNVETIVVCAYGLYIPPSLLDRALWLNVHPSLLPRWRGAAPIERAIMAGDEQTGVTIHRTVAELDAGPIAAQEAFALDGLDAGAVYARCAEIAARLLERIFVSGPTFVDQATEGASYAEKIRPDDRELDLDDPVASVNRVRALSPHIGARTVLHDRRVTVWRAHVEDGRFVPDEVQPEGGRSMAYGDWLRGLR